MDCPKIIVWQCSNLTVNDQMERYNEIDILFLNLDKELKEKKRKVGWAKKRKQYC